MAVTGEEIFDKNFLGKAKKQTEDFIVVLEELDKQVNSLASSYKILATNTDNLDSKKIKEINKQFSETQKIREESIQLEKSQIKLQQDAEKLKQQQIKTQQLLNKQEEKAQKEKKKTIQLTDEEIKQNIKTRKDAAQRRKDIEAELILEQKSQRSKQELRDRIKALNIQGAKLDLGSDELKANIAEIDRLNNELKEAGTEREKNILNIGNYKSATDDLTNSFVDQQKKLALLEDVYRNAVSEGKKRTKAVKELAKELRKQKEAVEEVEEATKKAEDTTRSFNSVLKTAGKATLLAILFTLLTKLKDLIGSSREATLKLNRALSIFGESVKVLFSSLFTFFKGVKLFFVTVAQDIITSFGKASDFIEKRLLGLELTFAKINRSASFRKKAVKEAEAEVLSLEKKLSDLNNTQEESTESNEGYAESWDLISGSFSKFGQTTLKAIDSQDKFLKLQLETEISIQRQTRALAGLAERRQILQDISDDDTLGFETRALAVEKARKAAVDFAAQDERLAKTREKLALEAVKQDLTRITAEEKKRLSITQSSIDQIKTGEQLNELLKRRGVALKISDENEAAFTEAFTERVNKQVEAEAFARDQQEKFRKTERDGYEQRLDIIEEFAEAQFAANEAITSDESRSLEDRRKAFQDNEKIKQDILKESIKLTLDQARDSIEINTSLTESEKEQARIKLDILDIDKLIASQDEQEIQRLLRKADLGEIEEKRLKETLKIQKEQALALEEQNKALQEGERANLELRREIAVQEIALEETTNEKLEQLDEDRLENDKKNLEERIAIFEEARNAGLENEKEAGNEELELRKDLNDLLLEEQQKRLEEEAANEEKAAERKKQVLESVFSGISQGLQNRLESQLDAIDSRLERINEEQSIFTSLAEQGNQQALNSLGQLQQQEAQAELERKRRIKEEQTAQKVLTYLKLVALSAEEGDANAPLQGLANILITEGIAKSLESFYVGTERLEKGSKNIDSKGGRVIVAHDDERIVTGKQNNELFNEFGYDISNEELKNRVIEHNRSSSLKSSTLIPVGDGRLAKQFESMRKEFVEVVKSLPKNMPVYEQKYDTITKMVTDTVKTGNSIKNKVERARNVTR